MVHDDGGQENLGISVVSENEDVAEKLVYLVQHGQAKPKEEDPDRSLSGEGVKTVERMARWAAWVGIEVNQIRHSGKLRAQQTAEILARAMRPPEGGTAQTGLGPNDDVRPVAEALDDWPDSVMLVSHLPFLSRLASLLVAENPDVPLVWFRNAALVGLVRREGRWTLSCLVPPELVE